MNVLIHVHIKQIVRPLFRKKKKIIKTFSTVRNYFYLCCFVCITMPKRLSLFFAQSMRKQNTCIKMNNIIYLIEDEKLYKNRGSMINVTIVIIHMVLNPIMTPYYTHMTKTNLHKTQKRVQRTRTLLQNMYKKYMTYPLL